MSIDICGLPGSMTHMARIVLCLIFLNSILSHAEQKCAGGVAVFPKDETKCQQMTMHWLKSKGCSGTQLVSPQEVGDCWLRKNKPENAQDFYKTVLKSRAWDECSEDDTLCSAVASAEIHLLLCGFSWLGESPERVWKDFVSSLKTGASNTGSMTHVMPYWKFVEDEFSRPPVAPTTCSSDAFSLPKSFSGQGAFIENAVNQSQEDWERRKVRVMATGADSTWRGFRISRKSFFDIQVKPLSRRLFADGRARYYVDIKVMPPIIDEDEKRLRADYPRNKVDPGSGTGN